MFCRRRHVCGRWSPLLRAQLVQLQQLQKNCLPTQTSVSRSRAKATQAVRRLAGSRNVSSSIIKYKQTNLTKFGRRLLRSKDRTQEWGTLFITLLISAKHRNKNDYIIAYQGAILSKRWVPTTSSCFNNYCANI